MVILFYLWCLHHRRVYQRYREIQRAAVTFLNKESPIDKVYISREGLYTKLDFDQPCYPASNTMVFNAFLGYLSDFE